MAKAKQPNILVNWGDDIGITNLSCCGDGVMGYRTPNIDRIAQEGMRFTAGSFVGGLGVSLAAGDGLALRPSGAIASVVGAILLLSILRLAR